MIKMFKIFKKKEPKTTTITLVADRYVMQLLTGEIIGFRKAYCQDNSWMSRDYRFEENYTVDGKTYPRSAILFIEKSHNQQIKRKFEVPQKIMYYNGLYGDYVYNERLTEKELQEKIESGEFKEVK